MLAEQVSLAGTSCSMRNGESGYKMFVRVGRHHG